MGRGILLTGATGFLGRYLLRDLLVAGHRVSVLVRPNGETSAEDRVREVVEFARETSGQNLPSPAVFAGDLREPNLALGCTERDQLARDCGSAVHAAASLSFRRTAEGEPHRTNAEASRRLFEFCSAREIRDLHHVSTAFVCGDRAGPVLEGDLDRGQDFHNDYERSKLTAELASREAGLRVTVYRPSVIVGDSRTGHTASYHGLYRFLELANRLSQPGGTAGRRWLPLRLPFAGHELRDLVPVDWVAKAITSIVNDSVLQGRTYHLTAAHPTRVEDITRVAVDELTLDGVELSRTVPAPSQLERLFLDGLRDYWPYLGSDPAFDRTNTQTSLPNLPPPRIDCDCLRRLVRFAVADHWGRRHGRMARSDSIDCGDYIERFFPGTIARSPLAKLPIETTLAFDVRGAGGGRWLCRLSGGRVQQVSRNSTERAEVEYRMGVPTFAALVAGRETPQAAFLSRRIEITGSIERGLKLAMLFGQFVREFPYRAEVKRDTRR